MIGFAINSIDIITLRGIDYHYITHGINKSDAIHLFKCSILGDCGYM